MNVRFITLICFSATLCFGQALPDRDELTKKFLDETTTVDAALDLVKHYQMGGLRTMIRNLNQLPWEQALGYGESLKHVDLMRFRNDLNANLQAAEGVQTRALFLMLLATVGRGVDPSIFENVVLNESEPLFVRLAAMSGVITIQNPAKYDRFHQLADDAVVDPAEGKDDLRWAFINKGNLGFYLYSKGKATEPEATHGQIISALRMVQPNDIDVFEALLDNRRTKYISLMIDRAVQIGGVEILEMMAKHRRAKRYRDQISAAIPAAQAIQAYQGRLLFDMKDDLFVGPVVRTFADGAAPDEGYHAGFAIAKIGVDGSISVVEHQSPFGGTESIKTLLTGRTFPAHNKSWEPVETYVLVLAP